MYLESFVLNTIPLLSYRRANIQKELGKSWEHGKKNQHMPCTFGNTRQFQTHKIVESLQIPNEQTDSPCKYLFSHNSHCWIWCFRVRFTSRVRKSTIHKSLLFNGRELLENTAAICSAATQNEGENIDLINITNITRQSLLTPQTVLFHGKGRKTSF